jgi:hypothetical protein
LFSPCTFVFHSVIVTLSLTTWLTSGFSVISCKRIKFITLHEVGIMRFFLIFCLGFLGVVNFLHSQKAQNWAGTNNGRIYFQSNSGHLTTFRAPLNQSSSIHYILPRNPPLAGEALVYDNSGELVWRNVSSDIGSSSPSTGAFTTLSANGNFNVLPTGTNAGNTGEVRWFELAANGTNYSAFKAADAMAANVVYTLPSADGSNGNMLTTNGSGQLVWSPSVSGSNVSATGDLTVGGNTILGNSSSDITSLNGTLRVYDSDASNYTDIKGGDGTAQIADLNFILPTDAGSNGKVLTTNGSGTLSWSTPTPDWSAPGTIGSTTPNTGAFTTLSANGALSLQPTGTGAGNTGEIRWYELAANGSNYSAFKAADAMAVNVTYTLPSADGSSGNMLTTNGSGVLSWSSSVNTTNVTASGNLAVNGNTALGDANTDVTSLKGSLRVFDTDATHYTEIKGPDGTAQAGNLNFILPTNAGAANNMLITDGSGNLSWSSSVSGTNVTASGDLTVNGNTALGDANTDVTSLKGTLRVYDTDASNYTDIVGPNGTSQTTNLLFTLPTNSGTSGQVLSTDGSGNLAWATAAGTLDALTDAKSGGANFSNSLIIGHEHTGTLNNAQGNTGVGSGTLYNISSGIFNTSIGFNSLNQITSGTGNVGIGSYAGASLTNQLMSIAIGHTSMYQATGDQNIAIGYESGYSSTGNENTLLGNRIFRSYQSGNYNVVIGKDAMYNGSHDQAGSGAVPGTVSANTIIGAGAFRNSYNGDNNVAVGYQSLYSNKDGHVNTVIGYQSGYRITGSGNVTLGANAGPTSGGGLSASNNLLFIDNSETDTPLIYGNFTTNALTVNGTLLSTGEMTVAKQGNGEGGQINLKAVDNAGAAEAGDWHIDQFSTSGDSRFRIFYGTDQEKGISISNTGNTSIYNQLRYYEPNASASGDHYTAFIAQSQTANVTYTLPAADGTSGQSLTTNGSGVLSWSTTSANWASPGTIGSTTPNTGAFTTLSASNNFNVTPTGASAGNTGEIRWYELAANGSNYTAFKAADLMGSNVTYTLPASDGTAGQVLKTDGAGNLSWDASSSGANASQLQSYAISASAPATGNSLIWNGTAWTPGNATASVQKLVLSEGTELDIDVLRSGASEINNINITAHAFFKMVNAGINTDINGFANGENGRIIYLFNSTTKNIVFVEEDPASLAINRMILGVANKTINPDQVAVFIYSTTKNRWILISTT